MKMKLIGLVSICVLVIIGLLLSNVEYSSIEEGYSYEDFLIDAKTGDVKRLELTIPNASFLFMDNPDIKNVLRSMWRETNYKGETFSSAIKHPSIKIQLADSLLFLKEPPRKEYVDYIYAHLNSSDHYVKTAAIRSLGTVFDNEAVRTLKSIIVNSPEFSGIALKELESIAIVAHPSENLALETLHEIADSASIGNKSLQNMARHSIDRVRATNDKFGSGAKVLTEPIDSGNTYPPVQAGPSKALEK